MSLMYNIMFAFTDTFILSENTGDSFRSSVSIYAVICTWTFFLTYAFSYFFFQSDSNKAWQHFSCSAPTGPAGQVGGKYIFVLFVFLMIFVLNILAAVTVCIKMNMSLLTFFFIDFLMFCFFLILASIELPFYFRLGAVSGKTIKTILFILAMLLGIAYLLFGDIAIFNVENPIEVIISKLSATVPMLVVMAVILFALPVFCLSMMLSVKLYRKGLENIEQ
ncbi:MAG: ABC-2 transporter permease [Oscillospiraceae bacterium]|nr:ABC-2 transporter permease [Oscillospiraceae bacterium]